MSTHLIVVDDEALLRRSLVYNLEQAGYRVSSAGRAEDALALARRDPPDLVLLDIGLPTMDGLQALRIFRQAPCCHPRKCAITSKSKGSGWCSRPMFRQSARRRR